AVLGEARMEQPVLAFLFRAENLLVDQHREDGVVRHDLVFFEKQALRFDRCAHARSTTTIGKGSKGCTALSSRPGTTPRRSCGCRRLPCRNSASPPPRRRSGARGSPRPEPWACSCAPPSSRNRAARGNGSPPRRGSPPAPARLPIPSVNSRGRG